MELAKMSMPSLLAAVIVGLPLWSITGLTTIPLDGDIIIIASITSGIFVGYISYLARE